MLPAPLPSVRTAAFVFGHSPFLYPLGHPELARTAKPGTRFFRLQGSLVLFFPEVYDVFSAKSSCLAELFCSKGSAPHPPTARTTNLGGLLHGNGNHRD